MNLEVGGGADIPAAYRTHVFLGMTAFDTSLTAFQVLGIAALATIVLAALIAHVISKFGCSCSPTA